jgi:hypothetical protein
LSRAVLVLDHDDDYLHRCQARRQTRPTVVPVDHDQRTQQALDVGAVGLDRTHARRGARRGLPGMALLTVAIGENCAEGLREPLPELVAGAHLQRLAVSHHTLTRPGAHRAGELLAIVLRPVKTGTAITSRMTSS